MTELIPITIFFTVVAIAGLYFAFKERREARKRRDHR
jgi:cbb3-type cytochrome oxidase subunit 3